MPISLTCLNLKIEFIVLMDKISFKGNIKIDSENNKINANELFSLKIIDSLYKKDIGKFIEILSTKFI